MLALVIGGSASGKSEYGERLALSLGDSVTYCATMMPCGEEAKRKIKRHKKLRQGKNFHVVEQYRDIHRIKAKDTLIIECISNLLANEMFGDNPKDGKYIIECIKKLKSRHIIVVSNNIFEDGIKYDDETKRYMEELSYINSTLMKMADKVTEVVCGIPLEVK